MGLLQWLAQWNWSQAEAELAAAPDPSLKGILEALPPYPATVSEELPPKGHIEGLWNRINYPSDPRRIRRGKIGSFVALDVETTGLNAPTCEIIEVAAIRFRDCCPVEKYVTLTSTKKPLPAELYTINHISPAMLQGKPRFREIASSLLDFIGSDNLVGHNLIFDLRFIIKHGADVTGSRRCYFDTMRIAKDEIGKNHVLDFKLGTLCEYFNIDNPSTHRAEGDAIATGALFLKLMDREISF